MTVETKTIVVKVTMQVEAQSASNLEDENVQLSLAEAIERNLDLDKFWGESVLDIEVADE